MKVTLCRSGIGNKYGHINGEHKGAFEKEFSSLEELVNYIVRANGKVLIVGYKQFTKSQQRIIFLKFRAVRRKVRGSDYLYI